MLKRRHPEQVKALGVVGKRLQYLPVRAVRLLEVARLLMPAGNSKRLMHGHSPPPRSFRARCGPVPPGCLARPRFHLQEFFDPASDLQSSSATSQTPPRAAPVASPPARKRRRDPGRLLTAFARCRLSCNPCLPCPGPIKLGRFQSIHTNPRGAYCQPERSQRNVPVPDRSMNGVMWATECDRRFPGDKACRTVAGRSLRKARACLCATGIGAPVLWHRQAMPAVFTLRQVSARPHQLSHAAPAR